MCAAVVGRPGERVGALGAELPDHLARAAQALVVPEDWCPDQRVIDRYHLGTGYLACGTVGVR